VSRVPVKPRAKKASAVTHIADALKRTPGKRAPKRAVAVEKEAPRRVSASAPLKKARMDISRPSPEELEATRALRAAVGVRDAEDAAAKRKARALKEHNQVLPVHITRADHARSVRDLHAAIDRQERGDVGDAKDYAAENAAARRRESFETWLAVGLAFAVVIAIAVFMTVWG
jgi:hypothetical protein